MGYDLLYSLPNSPPTLFSGWSCRYYLRLQLRQVLDLLAKTVRCQRNADHSHSVMRNSLQFPKSISQVNFLSQFLKSISQVSFSSQFPKSISQVNFSSQFLKSISQVNFLSQFLKSISQVNFSSQFLVSCK